MKKLFKKQNGDTIIEVLVALTLLTFVLVGAYYTASLSFRNDRDAQEHAEAINVAQTQAEELRIMGNSGWATSDQCVTTNSSRTVVAVVRPMPGNPPPPQCQTQIDNTGSFFTVSITRTSISKINGPVGLVPFYNYTINVTWPALGGGNDNVSLYYRVDV